MIKAGIVGASGYTGAELMRILCTHPEMEVTVATANKYAGSPIASLYPSLKKYMDGDFRQYDPGSVEADCDVVFVGLPHGESMKLLPDILLMGKKVVDLSADFRFKDPVLYENWYGVRHSCPSLLPKAAYGLPEINREKIEGAELVANPGCYPTGTLLGLYPVARAGLASGTVLVDAKSGVSGAGRKLTLGTHFPQVADSMTPYAVGGHRHQPEMQAELDKVTGESRLEVVFTPHIAPMNRGILCTIYVTLKEGVAAGQVRDAFERSYAGEPFIQLLEKGEYPETKAVQGSNNCHIALEIPGDGRTLVVMTAIDNLVKGASGQAVQNMNILCDLPEQAGLSGPGLFP